MSRRALLKGVAAGVGVAVVMMGGLYVFQSSLLYHPSVPGMPTRTVDNPRQFRSPRPWGLPFREAMVACEDDIRVHTWWVMPPSEDGARSGNAKHGATRRDTILFFHGNAANMGWRLPFVQQLVTACDCNVLMVDYRGFGMSEGAPDEDGLAKDARAALAHALKQPEVDPSRVYVFGRSLGGAVAIRLAFERPDAIRGVIVENTFLSIDDMVNHLFPVLTPFKWFLNMHYPSGDRAPNLTQPVLLISGDADTLVPPQHMDELHRRLKASSKSPEPTLVKIRGGGHDDTWARGGDGLADEVRQFLQRSSRGSSSSGSSRRVSDGGSDKGRAAEPPSPQRRSGGAEL